MKKIAITLVAIVSLYSVANSQVKNKHGELVLPEAKEFCIGVDALPILEYVGNIFNNTANNSISWGYVNAPRYKVSIFGKYMISPTQAYRANIRIGFNNWSVKNMVTKDADPGKTVEDKASQTEMNIYLGAGKEWRRGKGRLQGLWGAEGGLFFGTSSTKLTYGNTFSTTATTPIITDWDIFRGLKPVANPEISSGSRFTSQNHGTIIGFGARAFAGVEYFFMPKMSLGGEFGWGLNIQSNGKGKTTREYWDGANNRPATEDSEGAGASTIAFDTDNFDGCIKLLFYF